MAKMMKKMSAMKSGMKKMSMKKMGSKMKGKNEFFTLMLAAKAKNQPSFVYNGSTYKRQKKGHLVFYKK